MLQHKEQQHLCCVLLCVRLLLRLGSSAPASAHATHESLLRAAQEKKKKYEPPAPPPRVGRKQKRRDAQGGVGARMPTITPSAKCKLRLLKLERVKDYLLMEEEFVKNQELLKPHEERNEEDRSKVGCGRGTCAVPNCSLGATAMDQQRQAAQGAGALVTHACACWGGRPTRAQVDDLRGSPLIVGTLEEIIDEK